MRNIELKAVLRNRGAALAACKEIGATPSGEIHQIDTYFPVAEGRLKLRVADPGRSELVYYFRSNTPGARGCDYTLEPVNPSAGEMLSRALGVLVTVEKVRTLYLWENVRIHLDSVTDLGDFIEFEAVMPPGAADRDGYDKLTYLSDIFSISDRDQIEFSYLDLMLAHA